MNKTALALILIAAATVGAILYNDKQRKLNCGCGCGNCLPGETIPSWELNNPVSVDISERSQFGNYHDSNFTPVRMYKVISSRADNVV